VVRIALWVRPGSARPGVGGEHDGALVVRVSARAAGGHATKFLTPPKQHETEIRCYIRDPDGHLIEVGQTTLPGGWRQFLNP